MEASSSKKKGATPDGVAGKPETGDVQSSFNHQGEHIDITITRIADHWYRLCRIGDRLPCELNVTAESPHARAPHDASNDAGFSIDRAIVACRRAYRRVGRFDLEPLTSSLSLLALCSAGGNPTRSE